MSKPTPIIRLPALQTSAQFREVVESLSLNLPCDDQILTKADSPLTQPLEGLEIRGKRLGNRWAVQPMEGWDGTSTGAPTDDTRRRWQRFGASGAKLIFGGEAMAVCPEGRANPCQLVIDETNQTALADLRKGLLDAHRARYGSADDVIVGFQLTHSGRFCRPRNSRRPEPQIAFHHPLLDRRFPAPCTFHLVADAEIPQLVAHFVRAALIAGNAGADFVDIKHCHGYLLHEFLAAHTRPGRYGGSFDNRTRILREIVAGIRADGNPIDIAVRLSAFDFVPFRPDPDRSPPGRPGPGIPEDYAACLPYCYAFGAQFENPIEPDLSEAFRFMDLCARLGVKLLNVTAGSPYYNPHIQRPAAYPPSDGYRPPEDPLVGVARQIHAVRQLKAQAPPGLALIGSAYSYLQEFLPRVAQAVLRQGWTDLIGVGRAVLSYPEMLADAVSKGALHKSRICRTFSDCTSAPRNGLVSGCYPLDPHYSGRPEAQRLKELKRG